MIIATITFICDICKGIHTHVELTDEHSEIDIDLNKMTNLWSTVWIDDNNEDTVCNNCMHKCYHTGNLIKQQHGSLYWWIKRPKLEDIE